MNWESFGRVVVVAALVWFVRAEAVRADLIIKPPPPRIEVRHDPKLKVSKLILPTMYASPARDIPKNKLGALPTRSSTIVSGAAMSAGFALVGIVLLRKRTNLNGRVIATMVIGCAAVVAVGYAVANAPPIAPLPPPTPAPQLPLPAGFHIGDRPLEIVFDANTDKVVLVLDGEAKLDGR